MLKFQYHSADNGQFKKDKITFLVPPPPVVLFEKDEIPKILSPSLRKNEKRIM